MERMLRADYMDPQRTSAREARRLAKLLNYAIQQVPFYRNHHQWAAADLVTEQSGKELLEQLPEYLITYPPSLEALVYAAQGLPVDSLRALRVIGATLTPGMRHRIESATGITVQENYGLNEIGLIANRDPPVTAARKL
ncbi:MAG: phenylacetate-coenzyme A ligase PaaK-like adenylate-forming protein [Halieaceae bacterium]|jgi:phenylacetate-coenzyme A ligase PaaK-like adenylate-forming protein